MIPYIVYHMLSWVIFFLSLKGVGVFFLILKELGGINKYKIWDKNIQISKIWRVYIQKTHIVMTYDLKSNHFSAILISVLVLDERMKFEPWPWGEVCLTMNPSVLDNTGTIDWYDLSDGNVVILFDRCQISLNMV